MAEDHGTPEAGKLSRGHKETESRQRAVQRVRSWTVPNEMRGVLGRVSAGATKRIRDYADSRKIKT